MTVTWPCESISISVHKAYLVIKFSCIYCHVFVGCVTNRWGLDWQLGLMITLTQLAAPSNYNTVADFHTTNL
jgi:hypothetical protein